jgi:hypothetical protein
MRRIHEIRWMYMCIVYVCLYKQNMHARPPAHSRQSLPTNSRVFSQVKVNGVSWYDTTAVLCMVDSACAGPSGCATHAITTMPNECPSGATPVHHSVHADLTARLT